MWFRKRKLRKAEEAELEQARADARDVISGLRPDVSTARDGTASVLDAWLANIEAAMNTGSVVVDEYGQEAVGMSVALLHQTPEGAPHDALECLTADLLHGDG